MIATGVAYRRLDAPGVEELIGCGVSYGSAPAKAPGHRDQDVVLVGGANSAGQAALHLAAYARSVTMIVRADSLGCGMSRYLVDRVTAHPKITVLTRTRVTAAGGQRWLETVTVADRDGQRRELRADAMYVLIGGQPLTAGVEGWLRRDEAWLPDDRRRSSPGQPDGVVAAGHVTRCRSSQASLGCSSQAMPATARSSASPLPWEKARWRSRYCTPTSPNTSTIARTGPIAAGGRRSARASARPSALPRSGRPSGYRRPEHARQHSPPVRPSDGECGRPEAGARHRLP